MDYNRQEAIKLALLCWSKKDTAFVQLLEMQHRHFSLTQTWLPLFEVEDSIMLCFLQMCQMVLQKSNGFSQTM